MRILFLTFIIHFSFNLSAADNYAVGETLYVWAPNGLNLRTGPSTENDKIDKLLLNDYVVVRSVTQKTYLTNALPGQNDEYAVVDPYQVKGNWIEVETKFGVGYLVDIYLLKTPKANTILEFLIDHYNAGPIDSTATPTTGNTYAYRRALKYSIGHEASEFSWINEGGANGVTIELPGFTIEEAFVLMNPYECLERRDSNNNQNSVIRNWPNELWINDYCSTSFKLQDGVVVASTFCSC